MLLNDWLLFGLCQLENNLSVAPCLLVAFLVLSIDSEGCLRLFLTTLFCLKDFSESLLEFWESFDLANLSLLVWFLLVLICVGFFKNDLNVSLFLDRSRVLILFFLDIEIVCASYPFPFLKLISLSFLLWLSSGFEVCLLYSLA